MNNKPVAWAVWEGRPHDLFFTKEDADELCRLKGGDAKSVALYTHPVKELTDEEIATLIKETHKAMGVNNSPIFDFIKVFLEKAQE